MKYLTSPALISINQEINANVPQDSDCTCRIDLFEIENEDVSDYHTPASLSEGPFHSSSSSYGDSVGLNPIYNLVTFPSNIEYPALKATLATSFPDFDFSYICPWDFKIIKTLEQAKTSIVWNFSAALENTEFVANNMWKAIEGLINLGDVQVYQYDPDDTDPFSDMGYTTHYSYFFVDELKNKLLFLHLREGNGEEMSDVDDEDNLMDSRFGFGVF